MGICRIAPMGAATASWLRICAKRQEGLRVTLLETRRLSAFYGDFQALYGVDLRLEEGETVAIIGANGAGKSTFLKTVVGLLAASSESVIFAGRPIGGRPAAEIVQLGISLVPEGRRLFPSLSVEENLLIGAYR